VRYLVNYGYDSNCISWNESKKHELAESLRRLLLELKLTRNTTIDRKMVMHEYSEPYIEVDGLYQGVRIRKITALSEQQETELINLADKKYLEIMANQKHEPK
jgi:hypothetical protein